ncbi:MAG: hypothetical protein K2I01_06320, partial [Lachnospiraceae bacterium]|nr:hypothetical protein [Lachnospiraceae bacterium]
MDNERMGVERNIEMLCRQSQDENYTEYLGNLLLLLRQGRITVQYAAAELNRTYPSYQQRMGLRQQQYMHQAQYISQSQYQQAQYVPQSQYQQQQYKPQSQEKNQLQNAPPPHNIQQ